MQFDKINDEEVLSSKTLVFYNNDKISIFPFPDDDDYRVELHINLIGEDEYKPDMKKMELRAVTRPDGSIYQIVEVSRKFQNDEFFGPRRPMNLAADENYEYYLRFNIQVAGSLSKHVINFSYTSTRESK